MMQLNQQLDNVLSFLFKLTKNFRCIMQKPNENKFSIQDRIEEMYHENKTAYT